MKNQFTLIRNAYRKEMPFIMDQLKSGNNAFDPYFFDWEFTPIEYSAWQDIRGFNLPMLPQVPALKYFIDFADPLRKIGIECDGKQWHDPDKDRLRDIALAKESWTIYRIPGSVCRKVLTAPWDLDKYDDLYEQKIHDWFTQTATGLIFSIKQRHYCSGEFNQWCKKFFNSYSQSIDMYVS